MARTHYSARVAATSGRSRKIRQDARGRVRVIAGAVAVHPDARDAHAARGLDVMEPAARGMDPVAARNAGPTLELQEVTEVGLVASGLLRGDDEIWLRAREPFQRAREEIVIAVGQDADFEAAVPEPGERARHVVEERQLGPSAREHVCLRRRECHADLARRALQSDRQHLAVETMRALGLQRALEAMIGIEELAGPPAGERGEKRAEAPMPVDEGAEAVEADPSIRRHEFVSRA